MFDDLVNYVGWYSREQEKVGGSGLYKTPKGGQILVSEVGPEGDKSNWPDAVCCGPVTRFVQRVRHPKYGYGY